MRYRFRPQPFCSRPEGNLHRFRRLTPVTHRGFDSRLAIGVLGALSGLAACGEVVTSSDPDAGSADPVAIDVQPCRAPAPLEPFADERSEACWDLPDAPTAEACPSSAAQELGERCCVPGGCGFDFGDGCTIDPQPLAGDLDAQVSPCAGGALERVFGAEGVSRIAIGPDALFVLHASAGGSRVTRVAKASCELTVLHEEPEYLGAMQLVGDTLFIVTAFNRLLAVDADGVASEVPLIELLDAEEALVAALGTDDSSLIAVVAHGHRTASGDLEHQTSLVQVSVPCCDETPRVVSTGPLPPIGGRSESSFDGRSLVITSEELVLDSPPRSHAVHIDASTLTVTALLEDVPENLLPSALMSGVLYVGRGRAITGLGLDGCADSTLALRPEAGQITTLATGGGFVYWAESYPGLIGARIFRARPGDEAERMVQTETRVSWLGVDARHLYWSETPEDSAQASIARRRLPR